MSFVSKSKSESWTYNPQSDSEEILRIYNLVRQKCEPTRFANHGVDDIASACSLFFRDPMLQETGTFMVMEGNLKLKNRWMQIDPEKLETFIVTLLLIGVYKSKGEPAQLWGKDDIRPVFNAIFTRNSFQETLRMIKFNNANERRQSRSPGKLQSIKKVFAFETALCKMLLSRV